MIITFVVGIKINKDTFVDYLNISVDLEDCTTYIGCTLNSTNTPSNHLYGTIDRITYSSNIPNTNEIEAVYNNIFDNGNIIDVKKTFDEFGRIKEKNIIANNKELKSIYRYHKDINKLRSLPSSEVLHNGEETIYNYDEDNNITHKLRVSNTNIMTEGLNYQYDSLKRLKTEARINQDNILDYKFEYKYDDNGNIIEKKKITASNGIEYIDTYVYSSDIKDRLEEIVRNDFLKDTSINKYLISYNGGNKFYPSKIIKDDVSHNLVWQGKRLTSYGNNTYTYNENGIRIGKVVGTNIYKYILEGSKIISVNKTVNNVNTSINYHFDEGGEVIGFNYKENEYFFIRD